MSHNSCVNTWWFADDNSTWSFIRGLDLDQIYTQRSCIKHKYTSKKGATNCIHCDWEEIEQRYIPYQKGIRFEVKPPPIQYLKNRHYGLCWCGKIPKKPRRKYCSDAHTDEYITKILVYWSSFRNLALNKALTKTTKDKWHDPLYRCANCNGKFRIYHVDVDHIQAVALGGWMFDENNLRVLCKACHLLKTAEDMASLAWWRREANYDTGLKLYVQITDPLQQTLELFA